MVVTEFETFPCTSINSLGTDPKVKMIKYKAKCVPVVKKTHS